MYISQKVIGFARIIQPTLCVNDQMALQQALNNSGFDAGGGVLELYKKWFSQSFIDDNFKE